VMPESSSTAGSVQEPLLSRSTSPKGSGYSSISKSTGSLEENEIQVLLDRSPEADVIPETTILGRNLGWSSAYILIISRVIGSGIFATPGAITKSVGSVGLSLVLWVVGGLIAWFGLQIALEYGCMLPRSGGESIVIVWLIQD
jgi:amino acid permease